MDSPLNNSRLSNPELQNFKTSGTSLIFRTVGRNTKPSWSNRIVKDVNDLQYNIDIDLFGRQKFHSLTLQSRKQRKLSADKKQRTLLVRDKRKSFFSQELQKIIKSGKTYAAKQLKRNQQAKDKLPTTANLSTIETTTYGLSSYEFKNTISGRLGVKQNLHLQFDRKAQRRIGQVPSWYNPQLQIDIDKMDQKKYRRVLGKFHAFDSYTQRQVFESKDKLDKVYQTEECKLKTSPNRIKKIVPLDALPGRREDHIKESSYLSYDISRGEEATMRSPPKYSINHTAKQFSFPRQVISDKRGCYR